jgi:hypothetical protein
MLGKRICCRSQLTLVCKSRIAWRCHNKFLSNATLKPSRLGVNCSQTGFGLCEAHRAMTGIREMALGAGFLVISAMTALAGPRLDAKLDDWATLKNERHGFAIAYPVDVFEQKSEPTTDEGRVLLSKDGKAKLLVGAFENADDKTLEDYRQFLLDEQYAGADIDYDVIKQRWFVLSGTHNGEIFYQRVSFTCGGQLINSWAMIYPEAERKTYDRVLEAVARTYLPGAGKTGACD